MGNSKIKRSYAEKAGLSTRAQAPRRMPRKTYTSNEVFSTVRSFGTNGAHVTLPKEWIGKPVKVTLVS